MSYRLIYSEFWTDPTTMEEMSMEDRYFYLYLLTNPCTTNCGIYMISKKRMAFELGYSLDNLNCLMDRFENSYKLIVYNDETREMAIKNWGKYNLNRGGKPVLDCLTAELCKVKDKALIEYVLRKIKNELIQELYRSFLAPSTDGERLVPPQVDNTDTSTGTNTFTSTDTITDTGTVTSSDTVTAAITDTDTAANAEKDVQNASLSILQDYERLTDQIGILNLAAVKIAVSQHGELNVRKAINRALERNKLNMQYVSGILRAWAKEGYPKEEETYGIGRSHKNFGDTKNKYSGFKPREPNRIEGAEFGEDTGALL